MDLFPLINYRLNLLVKKTWAVFQAKGVINLAWNPSNYFMNNFLPGTKKNMQICSNIQIYEENVDGLTVSQIHQVSVP